MRSHPDSDKKTDRKERHGYYKKLSIFLLWTVLWLLALGNRGSCSGIMLK